LLLILGCVETKIFKNMSGFSNPILHYYWTFPLLLSVALTRGPVINFISSWWLMDSSGSQRTSAS